MPPKKNKRKKLPDIDQLKSIESRLLNISLKIENYIFKNRPISLQDAEVYIQEVSSYKWQCREDPRISQVTEKLLRQLKAVIEEGGWTNSYNVQQIIENSITTCPMSPTYSLQENDMVEEQDPLFNKTQVNEKDDLENRSNRKEKDKAIKIVVHNDDVIDLSSNEDIHENNAIVNDTPTTLCSSVQNIERSLSQLAIKSLKWEKPNKLQNVSKILQPKEPMINNEILMETCVPQNPQYFQKINNQDHNLIVTNEFNSEKTISKKVVLTDSTASIDKLENPPQNLPKKKGRKKGAQRNVLNNSEREIPKKRRKNKQIKNAIEIQYSNETTANNNQVKRAHLSNLSNQYTSIKPPVVQTQNNPIKKVYNNNVDLSWIESIRYIREVAPEEIDLNLKYYDDSFWDTFDLPYNWNDEDFL